MSILSSVNDINYDLVESFSNALEKGDYGGALHILAEADETTRGFILKYMKTKSGLDPVKALIINAELHGYDYDKLYEDASKLGYGDFARETHEKHLLSNAFEEIGECASRKDYGCADNVIGKYKKYEDELARAFIYLIKDNIVDEDLQKLYDFASRHGLSDIADSLKDALENVGVDMEDVYKDISEELMNDITKALETGDITGLLSKYGELLDKISIDGTSLRDIVNAIPDFKRFKDILDRIRDDESNLEETIQKILKSDTTNYKSLAGMIDTGLLDRIMQEIDYASDLIPKIRVMTKIMDLDLDRMNEYFNRLKALVYLARGTKEFYNGNYSGADNYFRKALTIDKSLDMAVLSIKARHPASFNEIKCIIEASGLDRGLYKDLYKLNPPPVFIGYKNKGSGVYMI